MTIRTAIESDLPALTEIYNHEVLHGTATFDIHPKTVEERRGWFLEHNRDNHPLIVAEEDGTVLGYASLSAYCEKEAYSSTVELSVYVSPAARGRGVGETLTRAVLELAKADDRTHSVISVITDGNEASARLHEKLGFTFSGRLREVGVKFGKRLDVLNYELLV